MTPPIPNTSEAEQRRSLRRSRWLATGLLLVAVALFVWTRSIAAPDFWVALARSGAEAAIVGGLADWFAVTALFRHPLGLPIPHTAIIPRNKDRLGEGLGQFVERNFLDPELVAQRLRSLDISARFTAWLARPRSAEMLADRLVRFLPYILASLERSDVPRFLGRALEQQIGRVEFGPLLSRALAVLAERGEHHALMTRAIGMFRRFLLEQELRVYELVDERSRWWIPKSIDRRIANALMTGVVELLTELEQPDHAVRQKLDREVARLIGNLHNSAEYRQRIAELRDGFLREPVVKSYFDTVWKNLQSGLTDAAMDPGSTLHVSLTSGIRSIGAALQADPDMRARLNGGVEKVVLQLVVPWRHEIARFIADVVRNWDARTVTERLELAVGPDLQFIRINGTLVGALVGCLLYLTSTLLAR